jgi:hypothetical protein
MPSTFKLSTLLQNSYAASATRAPIRHSVPEINASLTNAWSIAAEFTGTTNKVIVLSTGSILVDSVAQVDPITRATIAVAQIKGFIVYVARAVDITPPVGNVTVTAAGFAKLTNTAVTIPEGGVFSIHLPTSTAAGATDSLTIGLTGTTGYKVSVVAYGSV